MKKYYHGILFQEKSKDVYPIPYSPVQFIDGEYKIFLVYGCNKIEATSPDLKTWKYTPLSFAPYGTVLENENKYYAAYCVNSFDHCNYAFSIAEDKKTFKEVFFKPEHHGLDISFFYDKGIFRCYARMKITPCIRTIGYMESKDFVNWSLMEEILVPDNEDGGNVFYSMSVINTEKGYFGFLNTFLPDPDFTSGNTETMDVQLVWSADGITDWKRLNDRKPIIERESYTKNIHACASVIGNEVFIATISTGMYHNFFAVDRENKFYFTELYRIPLTELYKYLL